MIIPPINAGISIAGTAHAASKSGVANDAAIHGNQQAESAAKGSSDKTNSTLETGGTSDRGGDGRQVLDVFEQREKKRPREEEVVEEEVTEITDSESGSPQPETAPIKRLDIIV
jgi:hypothetical protein